jgi:Type II CAAX prenyl endopeptidase Rce1-like
VDAAFVVIRVLFSLVPASQVATALGRGDPAAAALDAAAVAGAFGLTYALRGMRPATVRQLVLCVLTVGAVGVLPSLLSGLLPHVLHLHIRRVPGAAPRSGLVPAVQAAVGRFLLLPIGFVVEEVLFRGALDTYVHRGERGAGWLSAVCVSALWDIWHLPGQIAATGAAHLVSTIAGLVAAQVPVGVPLSLWWRKSGNLLVTDSAHALESARTVLGAG